MRTNTRRGLRVASGTGVVTALLLGVGGVLSAPVALTAAQAGSTTGFDPQGGSAPQEFGGYVGYLGKDGASTGAAATHDRAKPNDPTLGDPGAAQGPDVKGETVTSASDLGLASLALPTAPSPAKVDQVSAAIDGGGTARVIVMTDATQRLEAKLKGTALTSQRAEIAQSLDALQSSLAGTGSKKVSELTSVPSAVYEVTQTGLDALLANPDVVSVALDGQVQGQLATSTQVIQSTQLNAAGVLGNGFEGGPGSYQVAIIDSGVDNQHNAFTGRIVSQACSVTDNSCLGGTNFTTAAGSGDECTHSNDCDHGTHVGSIAAGGSFSGGHEGVARGAGIVAIKVAQDNPSSTRWTAQFSAIDTALQHVLNLRNGAFPRLASVNLSIGTNATFAFGDAACNAVDPTTGALFGQLQAAGVAVLVAAGNNGSNTEMSFPGCAPNAMAIGATDDNDVPAGFTNSSQGLRWWAPGVSIDAAVPTGDNHGFKDGTSMATPHVTGAFALLRECVDGNGVPISNAAVAANLDATGVNVTRNGVTRKRINVLDAATRTVNNNDFANAETLPSGTTNNDFDFNVCSDTEPGEPGPFSLDNGIWWNWTPATTGTATISTEDGGGFSTTFDTTLAVYTGNAIGSLTNVAADDDSGTGNRSLVTFPVNGGTTYRIKVDGFAASNGLMNLHTELGPPPTCFGVPATIVGTNGDDNFDGTDGDDVIVLGDGNDDVFSGLGNDRVCGDGGDDSIRGGPGTDFVLGGSGSDTIVGGSGNDTLVGNPGGGSNDDGGDTINGGTGNDFLDGWFGNDTLDGGLGNDEIRGEAGTDRAVYATATGPVKANLKAGVATGGGGSDTFVLVENLTGSAFKDVLSGNSLANSLNGAVGNDKVNGRGGNDVVKGSSGKDLLRGQGGNDQVSGGPQRDRCVGGAGTDAATTCEVEIGFP
ncbi:Peptidase S8 and S53 subtilisin kexin sedolisin [metagenome]|uniref:Peptidase S8 and S53 subtilisin kexin sedolisin n=1 Tax=metagenome TaxID=256318 RepID=A0A2P2C2R2_9ZZZZ